VYDWCTDKVNCKSCIRIVNREDETENSDSQLPSKERHKKVMQSFHFEKQKIICIHSGKEQKPQKTITTKPKAFESKLFQKMPVVIN
jgi:hypothetical protein